MKFNMTKPFRVISESTPITIGLVVVIIGAAVWVTKLAVDVSYMKEKVTKIDEILYRVTVIEQQVKDTNELAKK